MVAANPTHPHALQVSTQRQDSEQDTTAASTNMVQRWLLIMSRLHAGGTAAEKALQGMAESIAGQAAHERTGRRPQQVTPPLKDSRFFYEVLQPPAQHDLQAGRHTQQSSMDTAAPVDGSSTGKKLAGGPASRRALAEGHINASLLAVKAPAAHARQVVHPSNVLPAAPHHELDLTVRLQCQSLPAFAKQCTSGAAIACTLFILAKWGIDYSSLQADLHTNIRLYRFLCLPCFSCMQHGCLLANANMHVFVACRPYAR